MADGFDRDGAANDDHRALQQKVKLFLRRPVMNEVTCSETETYCVTSLLTPYNFVKWH
jgi:hypothetical protein